MQSDPEGRNIVRLQPELPTDHLRFGKFPKLKFYWAPDPQRLALFPAGLL